MRLICHLGAAAMLAGCIGESDIDVAVGKAIEVVSKTQPEFYAQSLNLSQVDGCDVALEYVGPIPTGEAGTIAITTYADMKRLEFAEAKIQPNVLEDDNGVVLAIPYVGEPFPQSIRTTDTAATFQDYVAKTGRGSCDDDTCEMTWEAPHLLFKIHVTPPQPAAQAILAALTEVGAACGATGL